MVGVLEGDQLSQKSVGQISLGDVYEYEIFKHFGSDTKRFFSDEMFIVCNIYNHPHSKINSVLNICTSRLHYSESNFAM